MAKKTDLVQSGEEIVKAEKKKPRGGNSPAIGENMLQTEGDRLLQRHFAVKLKCRLRQLIGFFYERTSLSL